MTRKVVNKKLTRQTPVIPPIKEGEELRWKSSFSITRTTMLYETTGEHIQETLEN